MFTQLLARCRFGSALRTLALALLLSSAIAPVALADHMGNHTRPSNGGTAQNGSDETGALCKVDENSNSPSATQIAAEYRHRQDGIVEPTATAVSNSTECLASETLPVGANPAGGSNVADPTETMPAHPFTGHPW